MPSTISRTTMPSPVRSITATSVNTLDTQARPVSGRCVSFTILGVPSLALCSQITNTRLAP